jgi:hypothetical protein
VATGIESRRFAEALDRSHLLGRIEGLRLALADGMVDGRKKARAKRRAFTNDTKIQGQQERNGELADIPVLEDVEGLM